MKKILFLHIILCTFFTAFAESGLKEPQEKSPPHFTVNIEQNGKIIPIRGKTVKIKKAPFSINITMSEPLGVLVLPSFGPEFFDKAVQGVDFPGITEKTGMAEYDFNPNHEIVLMGDIPSYWHYIDAENHRFNEIKKEPDGRITCKRFIENINDNSGDGGETVTPVSEIHEKTLYLVFFNVEYVFDDNFDYSINEYQRETVKVELYP
ncbi:MAG: hypothetical protein JW969_02505 [Spirochaetales bacterium]|nr:hypothetical protein [Spirochaetales bacterium]